jgi:hypothetical protein
MDRKPTSANACNVTNARAAAAVRALGAHERFVGRPSEYPEPGKMMAAGGEE